MCESIASQARAALSATASSTGWRSVGEFEMTRKIPAVAGDSAVVKNYAGVQPVGGLVRVVFRVKTNRVRADVVAGVPATQGTALNTPPPPHSVLRTDVCLTYRTPDR